MSLSPSLSLSLSLIYCLWLFTQLTRIPFKIMYITFLFLVFYLRARFCQALQCPCEQDAACERRKRLHEDANYGGPSKCCPSNNHQTPLKLLCCTSAREKSGAFSTFCVTLTVRVCTSAFNASSLFSLHLQLLLGYLRLCNCSCNDAMSFLQPGRIPIPALWPKSKGKGKAKGLTSSQKAKAKKDKKSTFCLFFDDSVHCHTIFIVLHREMGTVEIGTRAEI